MEKFKKDGYIYSLEDFEGAVHVGQLEVDEGGSLVAIQLFTNNPLINPLSGTDKIQEMLGKVVNPYRITWREKDTYLSALHKVNRNLREVTKIPPKPIILAQSEQPTKLGRDQTIDGTASGHTVTISGKDGDDHGTVRKYTFLIDKGIKGLNVPVTVVIDSFGYATVYQKQKK